MNSALIPALLLLALGPTEGAATARASPDTVIAVGRLQYGGGGDWYANPSSLPNLLTAIREGTGIPAAQREEAVSPLDPRLPDFPFVHMTGHGEVRFTPSEREALRQYLQGGGFLHVDDNYGLDPALRREVALLFPDTDLLELSHDHPIFHMKYPFPQGLPKIHEHDGEPPQAFGLFQEGRLVLVYTHEADLGNGWEDPDVHGTSSELHEAALRMGVNLFLFALTQGVP